MIQEFEFSRKTRRKGDKNGIDRRKREEVLQESIPPMGFRMIAREFVKEKMAMFSLILLVIILLAVFIGSLVLDQSAVM